MKPRTFLLATLLAASGTARADVLIVSQPGAPFADLQAAIDAAVTGDTLLLGAGPYAGPVTIDGKGLQLVAARDERAVVDGGLVVRNAGLGMDVQLVGLELRGLAGQVPAQPGARLESCANVVSFEDCLVVGADGATPAGVPIGDGAAGVLAVGCNAVALMNCVVRGGEGERGPFFGFNIAGGGGGAAVLSVQSRVTLLGTTASGGDGGAAEWYGGVGGSAVFGRGGEVFLTHSVLLGGQGGDGQDFTATCPGDGGVALFATAGTQIGIRGGRMRGGFHGTSLVPFFCTPQDAPTFGGGGTITTATRAVQRRLDVPRATGDAGVVLVEVQGLPGDDVFVGTSTTSFYGAAASGVWLLDPAAFTGATLVGTIGSSGVATFPFPLPAVGPGLPGQAQRIQAAVRDVAGNFHITDARTIALLDRDGGSDCDGNTTNDLLDLIESGAPDCDLDWQRDDCEIAGGAELDCNGNGTPDSCDVASGASFDVNGNGIPDECEFTPQTWYVDASAAPGGAGTQASPFDDLQDALQAVTDFDVIEVAAGTYTGPRNRAQVPQHVVTIVGAGAALTVFDAEDLGQVLKSGPGVAALTLEGITFRRGAGFTGGAVEASGVVRVIGCAFEDCAATSRGGALYLVNASDSLVRGTSFRRNTSPSSGGGLQLIFSDARVVGCDFEDNVALSDGAGVSVVTTGPQQRTTISHCRFIENEAMRWGGAVHVSGLLPVDVRECLIAGNSAELGGGVHFETGTVRISGSTIVGNSATVRGGGVLGRTTAFSTARIQNTVLWDNVAPVGAQAVLFRVDPASEFVIDSSAFEGGVAAVETFGLPPAFGPRILDQDPLFVDADGPDDDPSTFGDNDYRLGAGSPAVDAGDVAEIGADATDIDGDGDTAEAIPLDLDGAPRRRDDPAAPDTGSGPAPVVDLGAYER